MSGGVRAAGASSPPRQETPPVRGALSNSGRRIAGIRPIGLAWLTVLAAMVLSVIGVYAIHVGEPPGSATRFGLSSIAIRQVVYLVVGVCGAVVIAIPNPKLIRALAPPAFVALIGALVFLLVPFVPEFLVTPRNGARAWINLGVADIQPSELCKIAYVLVIAGYLRYRTEHRTLVGLLPLAAITFIPIALITLQPDLGTSSLFVPSLFAMVLAAGARLRHLVLIVACAALAAPAAYPLLQPHQKQRLVAMVRMVQGDQTTADDINFQSFTAQALVGAGGTTGLPAEKSRALVYHTRLPEQHNDMIFSVIVNRFGLVGGLTVLGAYLAWIVGALVTAGHTKDPFLRLTVVGVTGFIAAQMTINIGMNIGVLPIIGITLPFVSYGGSSLLTCWLMTGLVVSAGIRRGGPPHRPSFEFGDGL